MKIYDTLKDYANNNKSAGLWYYLCTPYGVHEGGLDVAYKETCGYLDKLIKHNVPVYSPITHTHDTNIELTGDYAADSLFWVGWHSPFLIKSCGLIVICPNDWLGQSVGIKREIELGSEYQKRVFLLTPELLVE
jgi:hypothetical protein